MPRIAALLLVLFATGAQVDAFTVLPYIPRAGQVHEAFIQIRNPEYTSNSFTIDLFDLDGTHVSTAVVYVPRRSVQWINSRDLEYGTDDNEDKDVVVHVDRHEPGQGSVLWGRVKPPLPPRVSIHAYLRSRTGFVTEMSQGSGIVGPIEGIPGEFQVLPFFNPASNRVQRSLLRIVNTSPNRRRTLTIVGVDDTFRTGTVACAVPPLGVLTLSAPALEGGLAGCDGAFGNGTGKWTVHVSAADDLREPIVVMSLLHNAATRDIVNLSAPITEEFLIPEDRRPESPIVQNTYAVLPYIPRAGQAHEAFIQIRNPEYTSNALTIDLFDSEGTHFSTAVAYVPPRSVQWINSRDLEYGTDDNDDKDVVVHVDRHELGWSSVLWGRVKLPLPPQMLSQPPHVSIHAYLRSRTGFVTEMSQGSGIVEPLYNSPKYPDPEFPEIPRNYQVVSFFNPASNRIQRSSLRIVNTSPYRSQTLRIVGVDDAFMHSPPVLNPVLNPVLCTVPPQGVLTLSAPDLEVGMVNCIGRFLNGVGGWTVFVYPPPLPVEPAVPVEPVFVMSLLRNTAHPGTAADDVTNLSAPITVRFQGEGSPAGRLNVEVVEGARGCPPLAGCVTVRNEGRYRSRPAALVWWAGGTLATGAYQEIRDDDTRTDIPALEPGETRALAAAPPAIDTLDVFATDPYLWVCVVDDDDQPRNCSRIFRDTLNVEVVEGARGCPPLAGCVTVRNEGSHRSRPAALAWWTGEHVGTGVYLERRSPTQTDIPALEPGETRALAAAPPARGTAFATDFWVCVVNLRDDRPRSCSRKFRDIRF